MNCRITPFVSILLAAVTAAAGERAAGEEPAAKVVDLPLMGRVELERPRPMVGEPTFVKFAVSNPTQRHLHVQVGGDYRNRLGRPETFDVRVVDENGVQLPKPDAGPGFGGLMWFRPLPAGGTLELELFLSNWATITKPGRYTITVRRPSSVAIGDDPNVVPPRRTKVVLEGRASFDVVPVNETAMGERIAEVGERVLFENSDKAERATKLLAAFDDPRVVPYFAKLARRPHQSPRFRACEPLGRYDDPRALAALERLAKTTWQDVRDGSTTRKLAESSAASVRHSALHAMVRSPCAGALERVWTFQNDSSYAVRLTVLHAAAKHDSPEAERIVLNMQHDPHVDVRREADRYARERAARGR